ncbi:DUF1488 family protein [Pseudoxanthomonas suwonensis]|uniref:DUF1488 family protein n=1 Tax=Pseudoxanthomonas suwonensis TaxID=314722 RepID=UPI0011853226|nr:DUF1488 family protein [Pseudoxanthomonas suwonensis]
MNAIFTGKGTETLEGYSFQVRFLGREIACLVSSEALQDIDPENRFNSAEQQFLANQRHFVDQAERTIIAAIPAAVRVA